MRKSKYIGKQFGDWTVEKCYLNANYEGGTRHNAYHYVLTRGCSTNDSDKVLTICGTTMAKINRGVKNVETVAINKKVRNANNILYRFYKN